MANLEDPLYFPSRLVQSCSQIPHLNPRTFAVESSEFQWTEDYYFSLFGFPDIILDIALIFLFIYKAIILYKTYFSGFFSRQLSKVIGSGDKCVRLKSLIKCSSGGTLLEQALWYDRKTKSLALLLFSIFVINCFVFLGNHQISSAFGSLHNASNNLLDIFNEIAGDSIGASIISETGALFSNSSNCTGISSITLGNIVSNFTNISYEALIIDEFASPIQNSVNDFTGLIHSLGINKKDIIVISFFCAIQFVCLWFGAALHQQSSFYFRMAVSFVWLVLVGLAVMAIFIEQISVMAISDFCMNPAGSSASILSETEQYAQLDVLNYYVTCSGLNPFAQPISNIQSSLMSLESSLMTIKPDVSVYCFDVLNATVSEIQYQMGDITVMTSCGPIYSDWKEFMYTGVCTNGFRGVFNIWIIQCLEFVTLCVIMLIGSVTYQSFLGFEENRATDGGLNDWQRDMTSFEPTIRVQKLTPEEAARRQALRAPATNPTDIVPANDAVDTKSLIDEGCKVEANGSDVENPIVASRAVSDAPDNKSFASVLSSTGHRLSLFTSRLSKREISSDTEQGRVGDTSNLELSLVSSAQSNSVRSVT